jgi:hypothetical protein
MPKANKVVEYWKANMPDELNDGQIEDKQCFACGHWNHLQRCHIDPLCTGGSNEAANLHILCIVCHKESEYLSGQSYWQWYKEKINHGFDFGLSANMAKIRAVIAHGERYGITDAKQMAQSFIRQ